MNETYLSLFRGDIPKPALGPGQIIKQVAERHGFVREDLEGPSRKQKLVRIRQEAMWELRQRTSLSLPHIGMYFGDRDHTTVLHGVRQHAKRLAEAAGGSH